MNEGRVSVRYAKALVAAVSQDPELGRRMYDEAGRLTEVLARLGAEFRKMLQSSVVTPQQKQAFVESMVQRVAPSLQNFVQLVQRHQRTEFLGRALRMFRLFYSQRNGIVHALLSTSHALTQHSQERLLAFLRARFGDHVEVDYEIASDLIGGFTIEVNDALLDCSVAGELRTMLSEL